MLNLGVAIIRKARLLKIDFIVKLQRLVVVISNPDRPANRSQGSDGSSQEAFVKVESRTIRLGEFRDLLDQSPDLIARLIDQLGIQIILDALFAFKPWRDFFVEFAVWAASRRFGYKSECAA